MTTRVLGILALIAAACAFLVPTTNVEGGGRSLEAFGLWTVAVSAAAAAWMRDRRLGAGLWILACGARLVLTEPKWLQFVELRPDRLLSGLRPAALAVLAAQILWLVSEWKGRRSTLSRGLRRFRSRRGILAVLLGAACLVQFTLVFAPGRPLEQRLLFVPLQLLAAGGFAVLDWLHLLALSRSVVLEEAGARLVRRRPRGLLGLVLFTVVASAAVNVLVYEGLPHVPDEVDYLFQAEDYAAGSVSRPEPSVPEAFGVYLLDRRDGRWFSTTNPGWPLVLALGRRLGFPGLVNPLLGGLAVLLLHALARRLTGERRAFALAAMLALSPWHILVSASFMTHTVTLVAALLAGIGVHVALTGERRPLGRWAAAAGGGLAAGWVFLVRPLDGLLLGAFIGVLALIEVRRRGWASRLVPPAFAAGALISGSLYFLFNRALTGDPLLPAMTAYTDRFWPGTTNRIGFGPDVGNPPGGWGILDPLPGHGPIDFVLNTNQNLYNLAFEIFGAGLLPLLPIVALLLFAKRQTIGKFELRAIIAVLLVIVGLGCYWFSGGPDFGARYWYLILPPFLLLLLRGIEVWSESEDPDAAPPRAMSARARGMVVLVAAAGLLVFLPWRAEAKYRDYRGFHAGWRRLAATEDLSGAVVLCETPGDSDWYSAFLLNRRGFPADAPVFARAGDPAALERLREAFPGRRFLRAVGPSASGRPPRLVPPR